ncbi:MAG: hypothetical protein AMXMBFR7_18720 [Planctomycetota bacterium]
MSDAPPPVRPLRFGLAEILFVLFFGNLQGLVFSALIDFVNDLGADEIQQAVCLVLGLLVAGGAAYLSFRLATIRGMHALWKRMSLMVAIDAGILALFAFSFLLLA